LFWVFEAKAHGSSADVAEGMRSFFATEPGIFDFFPDTLPESILFYGSVSETGFRAINCRREVGRAAGLSLFLNLKLYGRFIPSVDSTQIHVVMTFDPVAWLTIIVLCGLYLWKLFRALGSADAMDDNLIQVSIILCVVVLACFCFGVARSKRLLRRSIRLISE
jgi:hypothetical protein